MSQTTRRGSAVSGVVVPILTPMADEGRPDLAALRRQVRRCVDAGVDAIFVGGSAGMGPMLTDAQWQAALEAAAEENGGAAALLAGIITTSTQRALERIAVSRACGASSIVVTPTFYIALKRDDEMLAHFEACRGATDQDMIVYNIPSCTASTISHAVLHRVAANGWTSAVKESSGDRPYFERVLSIGREFGINILQGNEPDIAWGLKKGAAGIVPVCANYDPALFVSAVRAARKGDAQELDAIQTRISAVREAILVGEHNWIAGIHCALQTLGIGNGRPLLPLREVDARRREIIEGLLQKSAADGVGA